MCHTTPCAILHTQAAAHLNQHWVADADGVLQRAEEGAIRELDDPEAVALLHVLDPGVGLALGVNHQWPALAAGHQDAVVNGHVISGQAPDVPLTDLWGVLKTVTH